MDSHSESDKLIKFRFLKQAHLEELHTNVLNENLANDLLKSLQEPNFEERFHELIETTDVYLFFY